MEEADTALGHQPEGPYGSQAEAAGPSQAHDQAFVGISPSRSNGPVLTSTATWCECPSTAYKALNLT